MASQGHVPPVSSAAAAREDLSRSAPARATGRKIIVFDLAYTLEAVRRRGQEAQILYRDLGGFFDHVWSVHPFATLLTSEEWGPRYGKPDRYALSPRHTIIEGKVGRFAWLRFIFPLNFLISQISLFVQLSRLIRRERISVIRVPDPLYLGLFGLSLARWTGIPLVVRVGANNDELREFTGKPVAPRLLRSRRIEKMVERFVLSRADLVAGANQNNLDFALANGAHPERSTLFRYGNLIDPAHFVDPSTRAHDPDLLETLGLRHKQFVINIGRLADTASVKHPEDVIRVLKILSDRGYRMKCLMVGEGPLRPRVEELAKALGVHDRLVMAGSRSQEWLAQVLPSAAVHVCPHAGRALSEGALAGVPTVAYDIDWQRELIETDRTGILVQYRDVNAMARAAEGLIDDPGKASVLGQNLRTKALEMLDPRSLNEHERSEYRKLLATKELCRG
jgi:glycosyltransferase involved in cell wall biosynthesis